MTSLLTRLITIYIPAGIILFCACIANAEKIESGQRVTARITVEVQNCEQLADWRFIEVDDGIRTDCPDDQAVEVVEDENGNLEVRF